MAKGLTAQAVEKIKPNPAKRREIPDGLLPGLYLVVQSSGVKSWAVRYRHENKSRKLTLGPYPSLDLVTARANAREALQAVAVGRDPADEKQARRSGREGGSDRNRVDAVIEQFLERHVRANNKPRTAAEVERVLRKDVLPRWGERRIQDITRTDVITLLDGIVDRGATVHANRVLAFVRKLFAWAEERGIVATSPCTRVKPPTAETTRDRVLTDGEMRLVWKAAERAGWPFGPFVQLLILTGQRRDEVARMRWSEIQDGVWRLEAGRTKNSRGHDIPLSAAAQAVLAALPRVDSDAGLVFTTTGKTAISGYSNAKERLDEIMRAVAVREGKPAPAPWRFHDLRRTVATGLARLGQPVHVVEAILNHRSGTISGVAAVYNRHSYAEEKRRALKAWGQSVLALVEQQSISNAIALRAAQ